MNWNVLPETRVGYYADRKPPSASITGLIFNIHSEGKLIKIKTKLIQSVQCQLALKLDIHTHKEWLFRWSDPRHPQWRQRWGAHFPSGIWVQEMTRTSPMTLSIIEFQLEENKNKIKIRGDICNASSYTNIDDDSNWYTWKDWRVGFEESHSSLQWRSTFRCVNLPY